jgi:hypothetical protein
LPLSVQMSNSPHILSPFAMSIFSDNNNFCST